MLPLPLLSPSKIELYLKCKQWYIKRYIQKDDLFGSVSLYALRGRALHRAIERKYKRNEDPYHTYKAEFESVSEMWREKDLPINGDENYTSILKAGYEYIELFNFDLYSPLPDGLEKRFRFPFPLKDPIVILNGIIDLITVDGIIADFKSSSKQTTKKEAKGSYQLLIYYLFYMHQYNKAPSNVLIYHLKSGKQIHADMSLYPDMTNTLISIVKEMLLIPSDAVAVSCECNDAYCPVNKSRQV